MRLVAETRVYADGNVTFTQHVRRRWTDTQNLIFARQRFDSLLDETHKGVRTIEIVSIGGYIIDETDSEPHFPRPGSWFPCHTED